MNGKCTLPTCGVKDGLSCDDGFADLTSCPHFVTTSGEQSAPPEGTISDDTSGQRLPWTGRAFGLGDIMLVASRSSALLVGLIGPFDAGKTGLLTAFFAHLAKAAAVGDYAFAGSYTLQAWAHLKQHTAWPATYGPGFPPHTPDSAERVPSLLHLAFRAGAEPIRDVLFTDAPGEWFTRWVENRSAENAKGARWIVDRATHFLFFVDRAALAGSNVGKIRHEILVLARMLAERRDGRPIITIWAKSDGKCDLDVEAPIREKLLSFFGDHPRFDVHVKDPACLNVLESILEPPERLPLKSLPFAGIGSAFLAYGTVSDE